MMPSLPQLLILIAVVVLLFGTKKIRSLGSDLGASIKGFKKAMNDDEDKKEQNAAANKVEDHASASDNDNDNKKE